MVQFEIALSLEPASAEFRRNLCSALDAMAEEAGGPPTPDATAASPGSPARSRPRAVADQGGAWRCEPPVRLSWLYRSCGARWNWNRTARGTTNLGSILYELSQREAETELVRAIELDPRHADAHVNLAAVCNRLGELTRAAKLARRALELAPDHGEAHAALAGLLREQGELARSIDHYRRAVGLRPEPASSFPATC